VQIDSRVDRVASWRHRLEIMPVPLRQTFRLLDGWRFHLGDDLTPVLPNTHIAAYMAAKAGYARGPARPGYDDSDWRGVRVPHDWSIEGAFDPANHLDAGYLPRGIGWYRRHILLDEAWRDRRVSIRFGAASGHATVFVNGHLLHRHFDSYTPFEVDFTDVATFGDDAVNTVAVRVDATQPEGWWYEGAGVYREVELRVRPRGGIEDVWVRAEVDGNAAIVRVAWELRGTALRHVQEKSGARAGGPCHEYLAEIRDGDRVIATARSESPQFELIVDNPRRWSLEDPHLYTLHVSLIEDGQVIDEHVTRFGIRTIRWDANLGFFLNGDRTKLKGACVHQDHAGVGVAVPASIQRFRVQRLREVGFNAIRAGHHMLDDAFMDACDELGMLVLAENRHFGTSPWHREMVESLVRRDRNRPSVIAWSLCNEEPTQGTIVGQQIARTMKRWVKELDDTRPVTAAVSGGILNDVGIAAELDVMAINYQLHLHEPYHAKRPDQCIIAAETGCVYATRDETTTDESKHRFADRDGAFAPWGHTHADAWKATSERDYVAGLFVWTGFDYRGEPTPHAWPSVQSHWGVLDLCGFDKRVTGEFRKWFGTAVNNEEVSDEQAVTLEILAPSPRTRGEGTCGQQGEGPKSTRSEADPHPNPLPAYRERELIADDRTAIPLTVCAVDASGRRTSNCDARVTIAVEGEARLLGTGNGDPTSREPNTGNVRTLFHGLAQAIVQTTGQPGEIVVRARAEGLREASITLRSMPAPFDDRAPVVRRKLLVDGWRMSPVSDSPIDLSAAPSDQDMNTWERVAPGPIAIAAGFVVVRASVELPKALRGTGGRLVGLMPGVVGAQVGGSEVPVADGAITLPAGEGKRLVALLVRGTDETRVWRSLPEVVEG
jgi:beta-galactosidase